MINTAEIFMWGTRIATVHQEKSKPYAAFEYDRDFVNSEYAYYRMAVAAGIEMSECRLSGAYFSCSIDFSMWDS